MGPENLFEIERVRDRERKIGCSLHKGTDSLVRDGERFEIEGVRDVFTVFKQFVIDGVAIVNPIPHSNFVG